MTPVITSPICIENLPSFVAHTTCSPTFRGCPSIVTLADPAIAPFDDATLEGVLEDSPPLEHAAAPPIAIAAAPIEINISWFTRFSFARARKLVQKYARITAFGSRFAPTLYRELRDRSERNVRS